MTETLTAKATDFIFRSRRLYRINGRAGLWVLTNGAPSKRSVCVTALLDGMRPTPRSFTYAQEAMEAMKPMIAQTEE